MNLSSPKKSATTSAALTQTLLGMIACTAAFTLGAFASDPGWWASPGTGDQPAVMGEEVETNGGVVTTNYAPNPYAVVAQGQLKQFTVRAVDQLNANLPDGAGSTLNNLVTGWAGDYATNDYASTNNPYAPYNPEDFTAMNVGQLKSIGGLVWSQLVAQGYTNSLPSWLTSSSAGDLSLANIGQLETVFNFDLSAIAPLVSANLNISGISRQNLSYQIPVNNSATRFTASGLPPGLTLNSLTGLISGSTTGTGTFNVTITASNASGSTTETLTLNLLASTNSYPKLQGVSHPAPEPALPSTADPYTPPVSANAPAAGVPVISEWTRIAQPNHVVVLAGSQFTSYADYRAGQDTQFYAYAQTAQGSVSAMVPILHADSTHAALLLPSNFPANSEVLLWPINSAGAGYPVAINATEAWWLGPNTAASGDTASVYGRNLADASGTTFTSTIYIQASGRNGIWATVSAANPYKVDFTVPSGLAQGTYQVWVHNNRGGHYGWSGPLALVINGGTPWSTASTGTYNVKNYGAKGDGVTDDTASIQNTLTAATNAWSTVYFPTGIYMISGGLSARSQVRWLGDGAASSIIRANANFPASSCMFNAPGALHNPTSPLATHDATIQGLAFAPNGYAFNIINAEFDCDVKFIDDNIGGLGAAPANFTGSQLIFLKDCNIVSGGHGGNGVFLGAASQVFIDGCKILGSDDVNTMVDCFGNNDGISFTGNTGQDYDDSLTNGWAIGRFFYGSSQWGGNRDVYVGNNTTIGLAVRPSTNVDQNQGEQVSWEVGTIYQGTPSSATASTVTYPNPPPMTNNLYTAAILGGTGFGQHRDIISYTNNTLTIAPPWAIVPDTNSIVAVTSPVERCVAYQNTLQGKSSYTTNVTASTGIQPYGNSFDFIADGNSISQVRTGIALWGQSMGNLPPVIAANYFNYIANNTISNSYNGLEHVSVNWNSLTNYAGTPNFGNIWVGNSINGVLANGVFDSITNALPGDQFEYNVLDDNAITNASTAVSIPVHPSVRNTIIYNNSIAQGTNAGSNSAGIFFGNGTGTLPVLRANNYAGFASAYGGQPSPAPVLESPSHVASVYGTAQGSVVHGTLSLWNTGTGALTWTISSATPWLSLGRTRGSTSPESGSSSLDLACDPSSLAAGTYTGTVTATGGGLTRNYTVQFTVSAAQ